MQLKTLVPQRKAAPKEAQRRTIKEALRFVISQYEESTSTQRRYAEYGHQKKKKHFDHSLAL